MDVAAMKHMASDFAKLDKFEGVDFKRWQKKTHFLLSSMSVVSVLTTPIPEDGDDATVEQLKKRAKWDNDDYVCKGLILNGVSCNTSRNQTGSGKVSLGFHVMEQSIECIFVGYAEHSKAFRFYVIEPNESVSINFITESRDAIFDENRFSSVPRPSLRIPVEVFSIWKAFGGNTRDLGSFEEETDETTNLHQHCSRISPQKLETASHITRDAVTNPTTTASQDIVTASARTIQLII
ncbi:hypothetical protein Tco_1561247 [Tanacetum coccineum]